MATFRSRRRKEKNLLEYSPVPFVPDFELYQELSELPSAEELAAIALALWHSTSADRPISAWQQNAAIQSTSNRLNTP